jgi:vancomycin permeability regulator SanA
MVVMAILRSAFPNPPSHRVGLAVVLGNHVLANDTAGCVLRGRLRAAIWLYRHHLVKDIMVSGRAKYGRDNPKKNEPLAMAIYCLEHHIPDRALVVDYYGDNTRYTVYHAVAWMHAHHIRHVVGVSSIYHLPRIYIAFWQLGVAPYTMASIKRRWREINPWGLFRECVAVPVYGLDTHYHQPAGGLNGH